MLFKLYFWQLCETKLAQHSKTHKHTRSQRVGRMSCASEDESREAAIFSLRQLMLCRRAPNLNLFFMCLTFLLGYAQWGLAHEEELCVHDDVCHLDKELDNTPHQVYVRVFHYIELALYRFQTKYRQLNGRLLSAQSDGSGRRVFCA